MYLWGKRCFNIWGEEIWKWESMKRSPCSSDRPMVGGFFWAARAFLYSFFNLKTFYYVWMYI